MSPELESVIENAYRAFADYHLTGPLTVCRCPVCVDAQAERELRAVPLREMPARLLAEYTHSAHGCDDQAADELRYFLPRYFELIAAGDAPTNTGIETCLARLHEADWRATWPAAEVAIIAAFIAELLRARLAVRPQIDPTGFPVFARDAVEEVLCMAAHAGGDIAALLALWGDDRGRAATLHIANVVSKADWRKVKLENGFWHGMRPDIEAAMRAVLSWLLTPEMRERLEDACLAEPNAAAAALLSHAESLVMGAIRKNIDDQLRVISP